MIVEASKFNSELEETAKAIRTVMMVEDEAKPEQLLKGLQTMLQKRQLIKEEIHSLKQIPFTIDEINQGKHQDLRNKLHAFEESLKLCENVLEMLLERIRTNSCPF
jgi:tRNA C32,U32 (ribose-2'-O)-methylase TrmJ